MKDKKSLKTKEEKNKKQSEENFYLLKPELGVSCGEEHLSVTA